MTIASSFFTPKSPKGDFEVRNSFAQSVIARHEAISVIGNFS
jgi:hypothetical protein